MKRKQGAFVNRAISTFFREENPVDKPRDALFTGFKVPAPVPKGREILDAFGDKALRRNKQQKQIKPAPRALPLPKPISFIDEEYLAEEAKLAQQWSSVVSAQDHTIDQPSEPKNILVTSEIEHPSDSSSEEECVDYEALARAKKKRKRERQRMKKGTQRHVDASVMDTSGEEKGIGDALRRPSKNQLKKERKKRRLKSLKAEGVITSEHKKRKFGSEKEREETIAPTFVYIPLAGTPSTTETEAEESPIEGSDEEGEGIFHLRDEAYRDFMNRFREYSALSKEEEVIEFYNAVLQLMRTEFRQGGTKEPEAVRQMHQTELSCSKLFNMLQRRALSSKIVDGLLVIKRNMVLQRFEEANQKYFELNIGKAAWPSLAPSPIGIALQKQTLMEKRKQKEGERKKEDKEEKGNGERDEEDKEREEEEEDYTEEMGKLILHAVKRLLTFFEQKVASPYLSKDRKIEQEYTNLQIKTNNI